MLDLQKTDFSKSAESGYEFELTLPTGEKTGAFVKVRGQESPVVKAHVRRRIQEYQTRVQQLRRRGKDPENEPVDFDELDDAAVENAIVRIIDWRGITNAGKEVPFDKESARSILKQHEWIRRQVIEESEQLLNFRPA